MFINTELGKFLLDHRSSDSFVGHHDGPMSFADTVFGFLEDVEQSSESSCNSNDHEDFDDEENESCCNSQEKETFWQQQDRLLHATLYRTSSIESKIRQATKEALQVLNLSEYQCICQRSAVGKGCRNCLHREICNQLISLGYDCAICKSKWKSSSKIPPGEHTYLEVIDKSSPRKREVRVVIELNFRGEFEMGRASEEYNRLIRQLPEVYVGKTERLRNLIKILCSAAKTCMKEKKMHLGPWRKHKYMQAKWLGTYQRCSAAPLLAGNSDRPQKSRISMLTFDLLDNFSSIQSNAVEVV